MTNEIWQKTRGKSDEIWSMGLGRLGWFFLFVFFRQFHVHGYQHQGPDLPVLTLREDLFSLKLQNRDSAGLCIGSLPWHLGDVKLRWTSQQELRPTLPFPNEGKLRYSLSCKAGSTIIMIGYVWCLFYANDHCRVFFLTFKRVWQVA